MTSDQKSAEAAAPRFIFSTPVWGAGHLGLFLNVCLPSLLAPGNLPALTAHARHRFLIYTTPADEAALRAARVFERLAQIVSVEVMVIRGPITVPHRTMSDCHVDSMRRADEIAAAVVFLPPDCVWSDGSMVRLEALARSGASVVHMSGLRLDRDGIVPELAARYSESQTVLPLAARDLVALGLRHLHPIALTHFWNEYDGGLMPANLVWTVPGEGLLLRCFHLHPLMVKSQVPFARFESTIDDDLALHACPDSTRDYVVTDSDELLAFEMSGLSRVVGTVCEKGSVEGVAAWAEVGTSRRHRQLVHRAIRLHSGDMTDKSWSAIEAESATVVNEVVALTALPTGTLAREHPAVFSGRLYAISLGRGEHSGRLIWAVRLLIRLRSSLQRITAAIYRMLFLKRGMPQITHPFWLVRNRMWSALQSCIRSGDRNVVLIGPDPGFATLLEQARPGLTVQGFASDAVPHDVLVRREGRDDVDVLIVIDVERTGAAGLDRQTVGKRRVLLRAAGDNRPNEGHFSEIRYVGGPGTWLCATVWRWGHTVASSVKPRADVAGLPLKAAATLLLPLIWSGVAIVGVSMNVIGLLVDRAMGAHAPSGTDREVRPDEA